MVRADIVTQIVKPTLSEFAQQAAVGDVTEESPLFGNGGVLDSLAFVSFVLAVEDALAERGFGQVRLVSKRAMSRKVSPFRTVGSLATYIEALVNDAT
jgi:acyl carrier protein